MRSPFLFLWFSARGCSRPSSIATSSTTTVFTPSAPSAPSSKTATTALLARSGQIHRQISSLKLLPVKRLDGFVCFLVRTQFDEGKSPAFASHSILHHIHRNNSPRLRKEVLKLVLKN